jgi:hypothetical protein
MATKVSISKNMSGEKVQEIAEQAAMEQAQKSADRL